MPVVLAAEDPKPLPKDTQISLLKAERQLKQLQTQLTDLQRQYEATMVTVRQVQTQMQKDCATAAAEAKIDLGKFTCDLETLSFAPKPSAPPPTPVPAK